MELWGGVECTVNRVADRYGDQCRLTGHHHRIGDLAAIASLGVRKLRYPILWERVAPDRPDERDWRWSDGRLGVIREMGMAPIVGLIHHGAGPRYTSLVDPAFPALFADHAAAVAERYPWVDDWTPVNEPNTTARFSALYGHWHPHARDDRSFWTALLNQIDATRLAMRAIRRINPAARLIQTDDLGRTYSGPGLAWVAGFYNHRRWLSWDLLAGRVTPAHPLWFQIKEIGLDDRARAIADDPCPADVIGVNHYVTSDRFLDDRAGSGSVPAGYHDLVAARVLDPPPPGLEGVLREAWARYRTPLAVTESQLSGTRDEQMRWLAEGWRAARAVEEEGARVEGFAAWALLGHVGWDTLLRGDEGMYGVGVFDVSEGHPRETALAGLVRELAADEHGRWRAHPALAGQGWWRRPVRLEHPRACGPEQRSPSAAEPASARPLLITGGDGALGRAFAGGCRLRDLRHVLADAPNDDSGAIARALDSHRPWAVIDTASRAGPNDAGLLARACAARAIHYTGFVDPSSGGGEAPPTALTVRAGAFFSPYDTENVAMALDRALRAGETYVASAARSASPTYVPDLVNACLDLVIDGETGAWRLMSGEAMSEFAFARLLAGALGLDPAGVQPSDAAADEDVATPMGRIATLPPLADALARHAAIRGLHLRGERPPADDEPAGSKPLRRAAAS